MSSTTVTTVASHPPATSPKPPRWHSGSAFFWGIVLILAGGLLAWLVIGHFGMSGFLDYDASRVKNRLDILDKRKAEDKKLLEDPAGYMDKDKVKIRVPISRAMTLALEDLRKVQPHPAYPATGDHVPMPAVVPGMKPAPGAAPAPSAAAPTPPPAESTPAPAAAALSPAGSPS